MKLWETFINSTFVVYAIKHTLWAYWILGTYSLYQLLTWEFLVSLTAIVMFWWLWNLLSFYMIYPIIAILPLSIDMHHNIFITWLSVLAITLNFVIFIWIHYFLYKKEHFGRWLVHTIVFILISLLVWILFANVAQYAT